MFPTAGQITAEATPLLEDLPGQVRMIAFWGEPGEAEPLNDTPVTFLGTDGRWRKLTGQDLGASRGAFLPAGESPGPYALSPDGSRWIVVARGWNQMLDFETGELVKLLPGQFSKFAAWAPDSTAVALWSITKPGVDVFDDSGRHLGHLPVTPKKRTVLMSDSQTVAVIDVTGTGGRPTLEVTTYGLAGDQLKTFTCAVPSGYPKEAISVAGYDGEHVWLSALVDQKREIYRNSVIDLTTGEVTQDIEHRGVVPFFDQQVPSGLFVAGIGGGSHSLYGVDPDTGDMAAISEISPYADQSGYSNHASSQYATDLVFGDHASTGTTQ